MDPIKKLNKLYNKVKNIFESQASWETKYDLIFSEELSGKVFSLIRLEYYDPDTSYEEDVTAFYKAFKEKIEELSTIKDS